MNRIIIFGNAKLAELAYFYFKNDSKFEVVGFAVNKEYVKSEFFFDLPLIPFESIENVYPPSEFKMFVAIGYSELNSIRENIYYEVKSKGYTLASYISSKASFWNDLVYGENCFILENQVIQPFVKIGNNVTIWGNSHFGHNTIIEDHCWISPHAAICGGVKIGHNSFIGANVTIRDNSQIGSKCIIGAGAIIHNDTRDNEVFIARPTDKYRLDSEKFQRLMNISK
jgi:sugar O-acyltransferase (sialic acid O-acetyltransferase NeuD family)